MSSRRSKVVVWPKPDWSTAPDASWTVVDANGLTDRIRAGPEESIGHRCPEQDHLGSPVDVGLREERAHRERGCSAKRLHGEIGKDRAGAAKQIVSRTIGRDVEAWIFRRIGEHGAEAICAENARRQGQARSFQGGARSGAGRALGKAPLINVSVVSHDSGRVSG